MIIVDNLSKQHYSRINKVINMELVNLDLISLIIIGALSMKVLIRLNKKERHLF